ncbi:hypothetical protein EDC04DRAFT_3090939 [Pisolithus marmoratus]|nr:hypothetical protein EDC04DRAFT_3090939 [Pisolithus marmoratus]
MDVSQLRHIYAHTVPQTKGTSRIAPPTTGRAAETIPHETFFARTWTEREQDTLPPIQRLQYEDEVTGGSDHGTPNGQPSHGDVPSSERPIHSIVTVGDFEDLLARESGMERGFPWSLWVVFWGRETHVTDAPALFITDRTSASCGVASQLLHVPRALVTSVIRTRTNPPELQTHRILLSQLGKLVGTHGLSWWGKTSEIYRNRMPI